MDLNREWGEVEAWLDVCDYFEKQATDQNKQLIDWECPPSLKRKQMVETKYLSSPATLLIALFHCAQF